MIPRHRSVVLDAGTTRNFGDADANLDIELGGFTSAHVFVEVTGRTGDTTLDVTFAQGAVVAAAFRSVAYTPEGGAMAQFAGNATASSRIAARGSTLRVVLNMGGTNGVMVTRVWVELRHGTA